MKFRKITSQDAGTRIDVAMIGPDWLGLIYFRLYVNKDSWMTFRGHQAVVVQRHLQGSGIH